MEVRTAEVLGRSGAVAQRDAAPTADVTFEPKFRSWTVFFAANH